MQVTGEAEPQRSSRRQCHYDIGNAMFTTVENIHHCAYWCFTCVFLFPVFRFRDVFTQPESKDDWQNADKEQRTPTPDRNHQAIDLSGNDGPHREA
ncbi:Uncharacterised protein [Shigella flexneri]|nr:Uncharacterised protein [Shigella sonnei]SRN46258.1 Uncharacterised protein [Shigella flexneri]